MLLHGYTHHNFQTLNKYIEQDISESINRALREDLGNEINVDHDITALILSKNKKAKGQIITREAGIFCGKRWVEEIFIQLSNKKVNIRWYIEDGQKVIPNQVLFELEGPAHLLLTAERTVLNFIQILSGIATEVNRYVVILISENSKIQILDTRKTLPGMRIASKYAVTCGGGINHRLGLFDAFLIKENHIIASGSIRNAVKKAMQLYPNIPIEVEVENIYELQEALDANVKIIMLDNFKLDMIYQAVEIVNNRALLEVSGNINEIILRQVAHTGIDYVSIGAITKHIHALDLSMRFYSI
ncbi:carboxylating nicotinate-nucleotide diphosphorylase [Pantoea sp. Aalb]|uniref:carboxylating nicotinate-nucleotide diphosphorylase n=1 Tax=Pantoea sp. Aalb TaxID=2576762 RepID=UPI00132B37EB|nr:carboxylating nicotinate-nucleotide diphosphorylase [Pantoea sp. Aalb]MXP67196.1 carboxylating nicotinate-nucleotide diphosphorylase [Pantoea sp. Aalb]